ncbi:MAG: peptidoglycan DD-metalloendopeptidase family protein [Chitinispirillia bacterium]|nr:peptidoglycan DD-metalloendopeptidase family protein [Chitinispirillia bacterium]MCL2268498.1 peptidoglycan DD-metalloendopeptidase family protein [Chitinispirillia bacterium]
MKKHKKNSYYSFMFFPEGQGSPFTLRIHRYTMYLTVMSMVLIFAGLLVLLFKTGEISLKLQLVHDLRQENRRLREHSKDLEISSQKIASIDSLTTYLHRLASVTDIAGAPVPVAAPGTASPGASIVDRSKPGQPVVQTEADRPSDDRPDVKAPPPVIPPALAARRATPAPPEYIESIPNIMPVDGWITKHFRRDPADGHHGVDIAAASGSPIRVTAKGVVEDVSTDKYFGLIVEVRHDNGFVTRYGHCSQVLVLPGDRVNRGQTIALVGNTGRSTAPHLHYEVIKAGKYVDPMSFIGAHRQ